MPEIKLFELGPTRSARARWALLEAGLDYESIGNSVEIIGSVALRKVHPLGKLPAAIIDGRPLFESAAIVTAIADLVPDKDLIAKPGTWSRYLHYQWVSFVLSEMEAFLQSNEINTIDFVLPEDQRVPGIIEQNSMLFRRGAAVLEGALGKAGYLVDDANGLPHLAGRCQQILDRRLWATMIGIDNHTTSGLIEMEGHGWWATPGQVGSHWYLGSDWQARSEQLYQLAADVAEALATAN